MRVNGAAVRHLPVEELAEEIWALREEGRDDLGTLLGGSKLRESGAALAEMRERGLVLVEEGRVLFTPAGEEIGRRVIRGHRLAEVLLQQVLEVEEGEADRAACEFEHMLSEAVTESVCTYLGHPPVCPHGKPIPRGGCCERPAAEMEPLVVRLTEMRPGESGRIVYLRGGAGRRLERLAGLGLVPGRTVRLERKWPTLVIHQGEVTLALDPAVGRDIHVRRAGPAPAKNGEPLLANS